MPGPAWRDVGRVPGHPLMAMSIASPPNGDSLPEIGALTLDKSHRRTGAIFAGNCCRLHENTT